MKQQGNLPEIRLVAFDLDGTFLDDEKHIPAQNLQALEAAAAHGIIPVPATGRLYAGLPQEFRSLPYLRYFILINGASIYDAKENRVLFSADLSNTLALDLFRYAETLDCLYDCYMQDEGLMTQSMYDCLQDYVSDAHYVQYMKRIRRPVPNLPQYVQKNGEAVQKIQYFFQDKDNAIRLSQIDLLPRLFPAVKATSSMASNIEINAADADKGHALNTLCHLLGIPVECSVAFGDNSNDLAMIQTAGTGIAMCNGDAVVRSDADRITACDNNAAGVGKTILELLMQGTDS